MFSSEAAFSAKPHSQADLLIQAKKAATKEKKHKAKDAKRLQHPQAAEPSGRYQPAGASDSSMSSEPDSPPRHQRHASGDQEAQYAHNHGRGELERSRDRDRQDRYEANGRHEKHVRDSKFPARHRAPDRNAPEAERYKQRSDRSMHAQPNGWSNSEQYRSSHPRHLSSASPPRRRHRTRSPA